MVHDKRLESSIESYFRSECIRRGWECLKLVSPGHRGMPDRMVVARGGTVAFVEMKRPDGGRLSALQSYWLQDFRRRGFIVGVAHDKDTSDSILREIESEEKRMTDGGKRGDGVQAI